MKISMKSNRKKFELMTFGFTLIELLAVLAILGILSIISVATFNSIQINSKNKLYEGQVKRIETSAKMWAIDNSSVLYLDEVYYLSLEELVTNNFIDESIIQDPRDNSLMDGCVAVIYENGDYLYTYGEECE